MPSFIEDYNQYRYKASYNRGYDGVMKIYIGDYLATGILLYDGRSILTAAHLIEEYYDGWIEIEFDTQKYKGRYLSNDFVIYPEYDDINSNGDLAIIRINRFAPIEADRYEIYRDNDEIGKVAEIVGYGIPANGWEGYYFNDPDFVRRVGKNRIEATMDQLKDELGYYIGWEPLKDSILIADFDDGSVEHDALGHFLDIHDLGVEKYEAAITPGDSGGPLFIDKKVAGIASYSASIYTDDYDPDLNEYVDGTFGEISAWQRASYYQEWIDKTIRENYKEAPNSPEDIVYEQFEDSEIGYVYFLVEFIGVREEDEWVSVKYSTRDGTAKANEDYIPIEGELVIYPDSDFAVIAVEIIDDSEVEDNEYFYLDVFDPDGGVVYNGEDYLTA